VSFWANYQRETKRRCEKGKRSLQEAPVNDVVRDGFELESPLTASMIEALHDSGYPFHSTPASAKNIWMTFWRAGKTSYITIPDNGIRMTN
jgi:hypothetical protein